MQFKQSTKSVEQTATCQIYSTNGLTNDTVCEFMCSDFSSAAFIKQRKTFEKKRYDVFCADL